MLCSYSISPLWGSSSGVCLECGWEEAVFEAVAPEAHLGCGGACAGGEWIVACAITDRAVIEGDSIDLKALQVIALVGLLPHIVGAKPA